MAQPNLQLLITTIIYNTIISVATIFRFDINHVLPSKSIALRADVVTCYIAYKNTTMATSPLYKAKGAFFLLTS